MIFRLAKILRTKKFREANNLGSAFRGVANEIDGVRKIFVRLRAAAHLNEGDFCHPERSRGIPLRDL
jgi:hypothetical protein